jgi:transcriptional regulator with XRE-family HTH domain
MEIAFDPKKLREARQLASVSQIELARAIAGDRDVRWLKDTVNSWERGRQVPSHSNVRAMAAALGVEPSALLSAKEVTP